MDQLTAALTTGLSAVTAALVFLYFDKRSSEKQYAKAALERDQRHANELADRDKKMLLEIAAVKGECAEKIKEMATLFAETSRHVVDAHQKQENEIHEGYQKSVDEMVRDQRREMSAIVDRTISSRENDREHDREEKQRMIDLLMSLERVIREQRQGAGRRGG